MPRLKSVLLSEVLQFMLVSEKDHFIYKDFYLSRVGILKNKFKKTPLPEILSN